MEEVLREKEDLIPLCFEDFSAPRVIVLEYQKLKTTIILLALRPLIAEGNIVIGRRKFHTNTCIHSSQRRITIFGVF